VPSAAAPALGAAAVERRAWRELKVRWVRGRRRSSLDVALAKDKVVWHTWATKTAGSRYSDRSGDGFGRWQPGPSVHVDPEATTLRHAGGTR
jgi:hypothetical protein